MAEKMYRKAGNDVQADSLGEDRDRRIANIAKEYGMDHILEGSLVLTLIAGGLFLFGANLTGNVVRSNFLGPIGFSLISLSFILVGIFLLIWKMKHS